MSAAPLMVHKCHRYKVKALSRVDIAHSSQEASGIIVDRGLIENPDYELVNVMSTELTADLLRQIRELPDTE